MVRKTKSLLVCVLLIMIGLPLTGVWISGRPLNPYLEFPPLTRYVVHEAFSWTAFVVFAAVDVVLFLGLLLLIFKNIEKSRLKIKSHSPVSGWFRKMPWWGWLGVCLMGISWIIAWHRFCWAQIIQKHTFIFLWFGYILAVNGLCVVKTSTCPMIRHQKRFWLLFPVSTAFWWFFEYLNRYVQNWYYIGVEDFSPFAYVVFATVSFSTVLPAVYSTYFLIGGFFAKSKSPNADTYVLVLSEKTAWLLFTIAVISLFFLGIFPNVLFPFLWVSPFLMVVSIGALLRDSAGFQLDKTDVPAGALAALICGFFWEMWNYYSLAKWEYAIPYVNAYHVFEMPVLGYGGYLPFGLECIMICNAVLKLKAGRQTH